MSRELRFDFPGLRVGVAEYEEGPTGCTVFHLPPGGAACSVDIRGGSPGTIGNYEWAHAVCFAGGSLYGLEAACGVSAELMAMRGYTVGWTDVELTLGAIVYDFGRRDNAVYPDRELGRAALRAAREGVFPLGRRGAGRSVTVGKTFGFDQGEFSGQGGAFRIVGPTRIAVFTVVNAFGAIVDREGNVVRGHYDPERGTRTPLVDALEAQLPQAAPGNTTLTLVVTNQRLDTTGAPAARRPGARVARPGDPAVPRSRRRRRALHGLHERSRERGALGSEPWAHRLRARVGRGAQLRRARVRSQ